MIALGELETRSSAATEALAEGLGAALSGGGVWLLIGDLGAGKTTFARGLLRGLGVCGTIRSPTFTLAIPYRGRVPVVHIDLYRLESASELEGLGWDDLAAEGSLLVVEWGERARRWAGDDRVEVTIGHRGQEARSIRIETFGAAAEVEAERLRPVLERVRASANVG